ncbi:MAG: lysozyme inhibitor LprI family protein [Sphingomicrobium sp.]
MERPNNTLALLGGIGLLLLLLIVFAATRNSDQDRLGDSATTIAADNPDLNKACAGQTIYNQVKRALFQEAQRARPEEATTYQNITSIASIRVENAAAEGEGRLPGMVDCVGSMAIDLPPGVTTAAGRRLLMSDVYYAVDPTSRRVVQLRDAQQIVSELAGLTLSPVQPSAPPPMPVDVEMADRGPPAVDPLAPLAPPPVPPRPTASARPSYDCTKARTQSERMVCADPGLANLDRNMAGVYGRAMAQGSPQQQALLRQTRDRFLAYRDNCSSAACVGGAYNDRIREIGDIATGRWSPPR